MSSGVPTAVSFPSACCEVFLCLFPRPPPRDRVRYASPPIPFILFHFIPLRRTLNDFAATVHPANCPVKYSPPRTTPLRSSPRRSESFPLPGPLTLSLSGTVVPVLNVTPCTVPGVLLTDCTPGNVTPTYSIYCIYSRCSLHTDCCH